MVDEQWLPGLSGSMVEVGGDLCGETALCRACSCMSQVASVHDRKLQYGTFNVWGKLVWLVLTKCGGQGVLGENRKVVEHSVKL